MIHNPLHLFGPPASRGEWASEIFRATDHSGEEGRDTKPHSYPPEEKRAMALVVNGAGIEGIVAREEIQRA
jgi:hypothetical protein